MGLMSDGEKVYAYKVDRMRWYEPVWPNDQLQTHARISERRRSNSRAGWGIMTVEIEVKNQHARPVLTMTTTVMVEA